MRDFSQARRAAQTVFKRCLALPPEGELVVVADETTWPVAQFLQVTAQESGYHATLLFFSRAAQAELKPGQLPLAAHAALREAEATILCVSDDQACMGFRTIVRENGVARGGSVGHMPGASWRTLLAADSDYDAMTKECQALALALAKGHLIRIATTSYGGVEHILTAELGGWRRLPIISDGIVPRLSWGNIPSGETYIAPLEHTAEGTIVINGALPRRRLRAGEELVLHFREGRLVEVSPGDHPAAHHLMETLLGKARAAGNPNLDVLGEIGIGVNRRIRRLTGVPLLDEKKYGTAHIALGHNIEMGGETRASVHFDLVTLRPEVRVDGRLIAAKGVIACQDDQWRESLSGMIPPIEWTDDTLVASTAALAQITDARLERHWIASSGRICAVPVGDDSTSILAAALWQALAHRNDPVPIGQLAARLRGSPLGDVTRLLALLEQYGLVHLNGAVSR